MIKHNSIIRIWSEEQTAAYLGLPIRQFRKKQPELLKEGFPSKDQLLDGFDSVQIEKWFDIRASNQGPAQKSVAETLAARTRRLINDQRKR